MDLTLPRKAQTTMFSSVNLLPVIFFISIDRNGSQSVVLPGVQSDVPVFTCRPGGNIAPKERITSGDFVYTELFFGRSSITAMLPPAVAENIRFRLSLIRGICDRSR